MSKIYNIFTFLLLVLISNFSYPNTLKIFNGDKIHIGKTKYILYGIDALKIKQEC